MKFLQTEFLLLERHMPGFRDRVRSIPFASREGESSPLLALFKEYGGTDTAIPLAHGGKGLSARELVMVQRAIGALSPALAVATNMHQFSIATLVEMAKTTSGVEWMLLQAIAENRMLVASAFAEGATGASILEPFLEARLQGQDYILSGSKKPCSLSKSMDLITVSIRVPSADGFRLAVALIPADVAGIRIEPFWKSNILKAAESDEVVFEDVIVDEKMISYSGDKAELDHVQLSGFVWFELLLTASYLGAASRLLEMLIEAPRANGYDIVHTASKLECSASALDSLAARFESESIDLGDLLGRILLTRYATQDAIDAVACRCGEALGGMRFIMDAEISYLIAATKALAFHPPSRASMQANLQDWLRGEKLVLC
ncbi:MAG: acyl-CoA dehydrogenase [Pseudomonadota bacterium]